MPGERYLGESYKRASEVGLDVLQKGNDKLVNLVKIYCICITIGRVFWKQ